MGALIELIFKIFQAIFEEDHERRRREMARRRGRPLSYPGGTQPRPHGEHPAPRPPPPPGSLHPQAQHPEPAHPFPYPTLPGEDPAHTREGWIKPMETFSEHVARSRQGMGRVAQHTNEFFHIEEKKHPHKAVHPHLRGKTPLEQMIYAQVILGPCKAHQNRMGRGQQRAVYR